MSDTAWAYLVVSSDLQADSLDAQRAWAEATAKAHAWEITRTFQAVSSGKHGVRKLLTTLIAELEQRPKHERPRRVLMVRLDRAGRGNAIDAISAIAQIRSLGVTIHTRTDGDLKLDRVADTLKPIFDLITGGMENEARSDRSRAGHERKRREGKHAGHAPYGTMLVDGHPVPYEPEAIIVRQIFEQRLAGWGTHRLARFAATVAPPKRKRDGSARAMAWGESSITRMLQCRTHRGLTVPEDLWDAVQGQRAPIMERASDAVDFDRCLFESRATRTREGNAA